MIAVPLLLSIPLLLWFVRSVAIKRSGDGEPRASIRVVNRVITQACLAAIIVGYPLLISQSPISYYGRLLPPGPQTVHFVEGFCVAANFLAALFLAWMLSGRIVVDPHHSRKKTIRRLGLLVPTTLLGAFVEEMLFRGIVLADLLRIQGLEQNSAVVISAFVFSVAHYIRPVKRYWTFPGHLALGILLGVGFVLTKTLWLSAGLHAGGIFMIMGSRPFFRYRGPAWLTGASIFPFAGVVGIIGLGGLLGFVISHYG